MTKKVILIMLSLFFLLPTIAYAEGGSIVYPKNNGVELMELPNPSGTNNRQQMNNSVNDGFIPNVTIDEASSWIDRKGNEVIGFLQKIAQPFSIIIFIISAFIILVGAIGGTRLGSKGLWGLAVSIIIYTVSIYAPELVQMFSNWLSS